MPIDTRVLGTRRRSSNYPSQQKTFLGEPGSVLLPSAQRETLLLLCPRKVTLLVDLTPHYLQYRLVVYYFSCYHDVSSAAILHACSNMQSWL